MYYFQTAQIKYIMNWSSAAVSIIFGATGALTWIVSTDITDAVQKIHVKRKLLSLKVAKPLHLDQVKHQLNNQKYGE